jgi:hypothetical protein
VDPGHDPLDALAGQLLGQLQDLVGGRAHLPHRRDALARHIRVRHPSAHHPRRLGDVDRGDSLHDLLVVVDLDLLACWHPTVLLTASGRRWAARGLGWDTEL